MFNSILNNRLSAFLEKHNVIPECQIGFTKHHRTSDHILLLKAIIDAYKLKRKHVYSCFIDFSAAFDSVWHSGLMYKLYHNGVSSKFVNLLHNMYKNLKSCVKQDDIVSKLFSVERGTKQGCTLSPTLFKLYLSDLNKCFESSECDPVIMGSVKIGCLMYADDVLLMSQGARGLQYSLNNLYKYCRMWQLEINTRKTKIMIFNSRKNLHVFKIGDKFIQQTDRTCYLGFMLTPSGKFTATVKYLYDKACKAFFILKSKYKMFPCLSIKTQVKLFDTMIVPILLYGSEVWGAYLIKSHTVQNYIQDHKNLIEKLHTKFCKQTLGVHKRACNDAVRLELGRLPLFGNIICRVLKYYIGMEKHKDSSIAKIALNVHKNLKNSWFAFVKNVVEYFDFSLNNLSKCNIKGSSVTVFEKFKNIVHNNYLSKIADSSKLKLYSQIKRSVIRESYLNLCIVIPHYVTV